MQYSMQQWFQYKTTQKIEKMKPKCATKQSSQIKSNRICCVSIYYQCADYIWVRLMCRVIYDEKDVGRAEVLIDTEPEIIVVWPAATML